MTTTLDEQFARLSATVAETHTDVKHVLRVVGKLEQQIETLNQKVDGHADRLTVLECWKGEAAKAEGRRWAVTLAAVAAAFTSLMRKWWGV